MPYLALSCGFWGQTLPMNAMSQENLQKTRLRAETSANFNPMGWCATKYTAPAEKNKTVAWTPVKPIRTRNRFYFALSDCL